MGLSEPEIVITMRGERDAPAKSKNAARELQTKKTVSIVKRKDKARQGGDSDSGGVFVVVPRSGAKVLEVGDGSGGTRSFKRNRVELSVVPRSSKNSRRYSASEEQSEEHYESEFVGGSFRGNLGSSRRDVRDIRSNRGRGADAEMRHESRSGTNRDEQVRTLVIKRRKRD